MRDLFLTEIPSCFADEMRGSVEDFVRATPDVAVFLKARGNKFVIRYTRGDDGTVDTELVRKDAALGALHETHSFYSVLLAGLQNLAK